MNHTNRNGSRVQTHIMSCLLRSSSRARVCYSNGMRVSLVSEYPSQFCHIERFQLTNRFLVTWIWAMVSVTNRNKICTCSLMTGRREAMREMNEYLALIVDATHTHTHTISIGFVCWSLPVGRIRSSCRRQPIFSQRDAVLIWFAKANASISILMIVSSLLLNRSLSFVRLTRALISSFWYCSMVLQSACTFSILRLQIVWCDSCARESNPSNSNEWIGGWSASNWTKKNASYNTLMRDQGSSFSGEMFSFPVCICNASHWCMLLHGRTNARDREREKYVVSMAKCFICIKWWINFQPT